MLCRRGDTLEREAAALEAHQLRLEMNRWQMREADAAVGAPRALVTIEKISKARARARALLLLLGSCFSYVYVYMGSLDGFFPCHGLQPLPFWSRLEMAVLSTGAGEIVTCFVL